MAQDEDASAEETTAVRPSLWSRIGFARWAPRAVFESLLIVFSVLLALGLSEWADRRHTEHQVAEVRQFFIAELKHNRDRLASDAYYPHHRRLREAIQDFARSPKAPEDFAKVQRAFGHGVHPITFRDAVWTSVSAGDLLQEMKPEEVFLLADVYRKQVYIDTINRSTYATLIEAVAAAEDQDGAQHLIRMIGLYLADVVAAEDEILGEYETVLAAMEGRPSRLPADRK